MTPTSADGTPDGRTSGVDWPAWSVATDPAALARYIVPDVVARHVRIPAGDGSPTSRLKEVWSGLRDVRVGYAVEPPDAALGFQRVRAPGEVLVAPGTGTCLDLALVLAGACVHAGLPTAVIVLSPADGAEAGHALVAVGLTDRWPFGGISMAAPERLAAVTARTLQGPPRDVVIVDPNGLATAVGATATAGLDTDLDRAIGNGYRHLTGGALTWRLAVTPDSEARYRPAPVPAVLPLREIYQRPDVAESVLKLVRAEYALTPFQARDELTVLEDFAHRTAVGDRTGLAIIHGTGGSGKTRLALELADRLRKAGWYAGPLREFITHDEEAHRQASLTWLAEVTAPMLVLVDYADARVEDLKLLLATVKHRAGPPAVVVVTARAVEGDWLVDVRDALTADLHPCVLDSVELADTHPHPDRIYERTYASIRAHASKTPPVPPARPGHDWTTLDLVLFGWLAATSTAELPTTEAGLHEVVLKHEQKYWATTYEDLAGGRGDRQLLATAGACLTLLGPTDLDTATEALQVVPPLHQDARWRRDIARTFATCLARRPGERWAIRPDPIGDYHLTRTLAAKPESLARWLPASLDDDAVLPPMLVLQRASTDSQLFESLLRASPERWPLVLAIATALGGPAGQALETLVQATDCPLPLNELSEQLPFHATRLWHLARLVDERQLHAASNAPQQHAELLLRVSVRRANAGDRAGALVAIDEAVAFYRKLAEANPGVFLS
ncbi:hypothetical protein AAFH96_10820, partial [Polymorphospora sp. 2-325]